MSGGQAAREGQGARYFAAVAEAEAVHEAFGRVPAQSPIGVRIKYVVAMSRLPERGGRLAARRSAQRAGIVASLERDKAAMTVNYLPVIAYDENGGAPQPRAWRRPQPVNAEGLRAGRGFRVAQTALGGLGPSW